MDNDSIGFRIVALAASVPEGIPMEWQGRELASGPLTIELDESSQGEENRGLLDYARRRAQADFRVRITFPELTSALEDLGVDPAYAALGSTLGDRRDGRVYVPDARIRMAVRVAIATRRPLLLKGDPGSGDPAWLHRRAARAGPRPDAACSCRVTFGGGDTQRSQLRPERPLRATAS